MYTGAGIVAMEDNHTLGKLHVFTELGSELMPTNALVDLDLDRVSKIGPNKCRCFKQSEQTSVFARQRS
jgi:hypothetical protein